MDGISIGPWWQTTHEWLIEDLRFEYEQRNMFLLLLRKHPDDSTSEGYRIIINTLNDRIKNMRRNYKKVYGTNPKLRIDPIQPNNQQAVYAN
jgi:hypothetical protein